MADKRLIQLEYDKFLLKDSSNNVSPIAVVNPDGSNISGGGGGSNATVYLGAEIPAGTKQIGSVTVSNTVAVTGTFYQATQPVSFGLVSLASGTEIRSLATILNFPTSYPVTGTFWQATQPVSFTGNATLNPSPNYIGLVTAYPGAAFPVTDNSGSLTVDWTSGATVAISTMPNISVGNVTLNTSPNQIGSVTVSNTVTVTGTVAATQSGTWTVGHNSNVTLNASNAFIGLVTVANSVPVTGTFWQSTQPVSMGNVTLNPSSNFIGLVTAYPGAAFPVTDNAGSLTVDNPTISVVGGGAEATAQRVTIANDSTGVLSVDDNGGSLTVDDGAGSLTVDYATTGSGTSTGALRVELPTNGTGTVGLNAGTNAIGKLAANSGVDIGDVDILSTTFPTLVSTSTYSPSSFQNLGANATLNVKASAGNVFSVYCNNENASDRYIQLHNTATTPAGAAVPLYTFRVPAGGDVLVGTDFFTNAGANFSTGIAFAFSTTKDTYTAGTASEQSTIIMYK